MMVSREQELTVKSTTRWHILCRAFLVLLFISAGCAKESKPPLLETILDEYIFYNELTEESHYLKASIGEAAIKGTYALVLEYWYLAIDEVVLPEIYLYASYKGIDVYFSVDNVKQGLLISNHLDLEIRRNAKVYDGLLSSNEYFNDIQLICDGTGQYVVSVLGDAPNGHFERVFRDRGVME